MKQPKKTVPLMTFIEGNDHLKVAEFARMFGKTHAGMIKIIRRADSGQTDYRVEVTALGPRLWIHQPEWVAR